jgi:hypothetical protein
MMVKKESYELRVKSQKLFRAAGYELQLKATSKNVIPAPIFIGINSSRIPESFDITGLRPEFIPYLIRGESDKLIIIRGSLKTWHSTLIGMMEKWNDGMMLRVAGYRLETNRDWGLR